MKKHYWTIRCLK